jgi:outer membrane biosynthesis protein TonB
MSKKYRSARGKNVDLSQVLHDNENVRAVGNMNVNARGDTIDSQNNTVQSRNDRVKNAYRKQHKKQVSDDSVPASSSKSKLDKVPKKATRAKVKPAPAPKPVEVPKVKEEPKPVEVPKVKEAPKPVEVPKVKEAPKPVEETNTNQGGLAAAIAKARESKQELMKTERQQARESEGVKRI